MRRPEYSVVHTEAYADATVSRDGERTVTVEAHYTADGNRSLSRAHLSERAARELLADLEFALREV